MDEQLICRAVEQAVREAGMAVMTLEKAKRLIDKVEKKAEEMGVRAIIAVANTAARPVAVHCMDNAYIARNKWENSRSLGRKRRHAGAGYFFGSLWERSI